ncbi:hypothetical protein E7T06_08020 [Deinococcus sp. Arct2-2]|uniref:hypothetical protein n=1 Tax=Deinococcus sp. Arct2-2 TaxID=2568653 RepID=UPI0010A356C3|nr:hypothetical protein [Deinococcus sp. Arct2-2]THF70400.1 hypothetical protein E7T06_08020 [Deinococcus sp. Arct2-2]
MGTGADPDPVIRAHVAGHLEASDALLMTLATDPQDEVQAADPRDWKTAAGLTEEEQRQAIDSLWDDRLYVLAQNPHLLPELLNHLAAIARSGNAGARETVAGNLTLPLLTPLARDPEDSVRVAVAQQGRLSPELLLELASDPEYRVRQAVARNPATPPEALEQLAEAPWLAQSVVANPNVPLALLHRIMTGPQAPDVHPWLLTKARPEVLGALSLYTTGERLVARRHPSMTA